MDTAKVDLPNLALYQILVNYGFLANILIFGLSRVNAVVFGTSPIGAVTGLGLFVLGIIVSIAMLVIVYQFTTAAGSHIALRIICCLFMFIPCVSLLTLAILSSSASKILKEKGYAVGLMGVSSSTLQDIRQAN